MATTNGSPARASSSTSELRQHYTSATRSFLVRDYAGTASSLHDALALVAAVPQRAWFDAVQARTPVPAEVALRRRLDVLQITFLATVRSTPGSLAPAPALQPLLERTPAQLVQALWHGLLHPGTAPGKEEAGEILPTPAAARLHPSLAVALALAALKLDEPAQARAVAEAWLGSVDEEVEALVWETAGAADWSGEEGAELALDAVGGGGCGMSASFVGGGAVGKGALQQHGAERQLLAAWLRLVDLLTLHILPKLGEWDAAGDFVRLQGVQNGGWIPDDRVEAALRRLTDLQRDEAQLASARAQRQADLAAARAAASKRSSSRSDKGKSRAREGSPTDSGGSGSGSGSASSGGSPSGKSKSRRRAAAAAGTSPRASPPLSGGVDASATTTGFGGLRDSLSSYLAPRAGDDSSAGPPAQAQPQPQRGALRALVASLRAHYAADPVRVVSLVCFTFAFVTWARRRTRLRRARGERGLGVAEAVRLVGARVAQTVAMMTKVTAM
ncbi:hypothetical protein JCM10449v2_005365 [Rhodotorula kratochvilovae]